MMHAWRNARTATAAPRAAIGGLAATHSAAAAAALLSLRPLWLQRGFASKNPFGRGGVARAENPWGSNNNSSATRATNAAHTQQQHQPQHPPPPRNERRGRSSEPSGGGGGGGGGGARNAWATRSRDGGSSAASSAAVGKQHYRPRTVGAAAAAANPRPKSEARSAINANGPAWVPVAAKFAEATAWTPAPQKAWSRGGGAKQQSDAAATPPTSAGAQSWARSAARRERSHGAPLPDLSAPASTQPPPGSHKRGSRPTAEGRSSYRHGGERDARSKIRERERERYPAGPAPSFLSDPSSEPRAPPRSAPRPFAETAELEEDVAEHVESTKSAAEFWTHFPSIASKDAKHKGAAATTSNAQVPQRLVPLPVEPEQYKPVFLNHPPASGTAAPVSAAATSSRPVRAPAVASKVRGSELAELMGHSVPSVSLSRSTIRLGVLLPEPPAQDLGFVDPEAPPPSESDRALEAFHESVRARVEGLSQELATAAQAELVTHPLHVDMCAEYVPMDLADVTGGTAALAAPVAAASDSVDSSAAESQLPPDPLLVLQLFESSIRHAPNSHRGHLRIRADSSTGQASGVRGTALKGQGFFPSFFDYFKHAAARVHRDANEAKLMSRNALIRAVGWKPATAQGSAAAAAEAEEEEEDEDDEGAAADATAAESEQTASPKESNSAAAASASTPAKTAAAASSKPSRRLRLRNVAAQLPQPLSNVTVMDATAGFGVDAFTLAMSGATVHAYESYPLFQTLLRQAFSLIRAPPSDGDAAADVAPPKALDGRLQFVLDRVRLHEADALQAMTDAAAAADGASSATARPDVVYLDLYPPSTSLSPAALPFRVSIRSRYLRLLCDRPSAREVDQMLEAALRMARSHVVMKFPSRGEHYRPGDAIPGAAVTEAPAAAAWEVARIFKHKHMQSEFVVYRRKE